jgi:hypothetical protein
MSRTKPICVYCGERQGITRDHIPPKGLFSKPRPNLVTVPCCVECQSGQSLDDEYFLHMISIRSDIAENSSARAARDSTHRSFAKPAKMRLTRALFRAIKSAAAYSPSGIYLGQRMAYDVDLERLCRVIERTTRGLYFHEFGHRMSDQDDCRTYGIDGFASAGPDIAAEVQKLWGYAISGKRRDFGEKVFTYWVQKIDGPEDSALTLWAFLIYGLVPFLAVTGRKFSPRPAG